MPTVHSVHDNGNAVFLRQLREIAGREPAVVIGAEEFRRTMTTDRLLHRPEKIIKSRHIGALRLSQSVKAGEYRF